MPTSVTSSYSRVTPYTQSLMVTMGENVFQGLLAVLLFLGCGHKSLGTELSEESKEDIESSSILFFLSGSDAVSGISAWVF